MNKKLERANDLYNILPEEGKQRVLDFTKALLTAEKESRKSDEDRKENIKLRALNVKLMKYKEYVGSVEYSEVDKMYFGKIQGIDSIVVYGGETIDELEEIFCEAVDEFIEGYEKNNLEPPVSYKELRTSTS